MKLSLMMLNLTRSVFMDEHFQQKQKVDPAEYESALKLAHEAGYMAVDLSNMEFELLGVDTVKSLLQKYQLQCASLILFENFTCCEEKEQERVRRHTEQLIDVAHETGCPKLMLVAPGAQPGLDRAALKRGLVQNLSSATSYAREKGVTVCIEDFPSLEVPMCRAEDVRELLQQVDGLKLVYDSANMLVENQQPEQYFDTFRDQIAYYHLKDVRIAEADSPFGDVMHDGKRMIATRHGKGIIDFPRLLERIKEIGYDGFLSVEYAFDQENSRSVEEDIKEALWSLESM